jgi:hypothetical protein
MTGELVLWAAIGGAPDYEVSTDGRVRRGGDDVPTWVNAGGYVCVTLERQGRASAPFYVHRLILLSFDELPAGRQVNHDNGHKPDNRLDNLHWASCAENVKHAWATGLQPRERAKRETCRHGHPRAQRYRQRSRAGELRTWARCARCRRVRARLARARQRGLVSLFELGG